MPSAVGLWEGHPMLLSLFQFLYDARMFMEYKIFEDEGLRLLIPKTFRGRRNANTYSAGNISKPDKHGIHMELTIAYDIPLELKNGLIKAILQKRINSPQLGVSFEIIRQEEMPRSDGAEILAKIINPQKILYRWTMLCQLGKHSIYMDWIADLDQESFEKLGIEIRDSIQIKDKSS